MRLAGDACGTLVARVTLGNMTRSGGGSFYRFASVKASDARYERRIFASSLVFLHALCGLLHFAKRFARHG